MLSKIAVVLNGSYRPVAAATAVFPIRIPPLCERHGDIPLLVQYFMQKYARRMGKRIETVPAATMQKLVDWSWPENVRELQNMIERGVILSRGFVLEIPLTELE